MPNVAITLMIIVFGMIVTEVACHGSVAPLVIHFGQLVDNESNSADCLSCHDATTAKEVGYQRWSHKSSANPLGSHPIEINYPEDWSGSAKYVPRSEIGKAGLRLLDSKVTCITCHDLRLQKRKYLLPVTMDASELCFSCHRI